MDEDNMEQPREEIRDDSQPSELRERLNLLEESWLADDWSTVVDMVRRDGEVFRKTTERQANFRVDHSSRRFTTFQYTTIAEREEQRDQEEAEGRPKGSEGS
jgi:hypothetical protein